jgi:antitoxin component YwqK of YwqJK toxin-antitoxin module
MTEQINQYDSQGREHGVWEWYWSNGNLMWREHYLHGKKHGLWEGYRPTGTLAWKCQYHHGIAHGLWERYHLDAVLKEREYYLNIK